VQSGKTQGQGSLTINVIAEVYEGSLDSAYCRWDFGDGTIVHKCNPPSHTYETAGDYTMRLNVDTYCGSLDERTMRVVVEEETDELEEADESEESEETEEPEEDVMVSSEDHETRIVTLRRVQDDNSSVSSDSSKEFEPESCTPSVSTGVLITEIFPNPEAGEEWVEILNTTSQQISLCGWIIDDIKDGGSRPWNIPEGVAIAAQEYALFTQEQTGLQLNNSGDEVWLVPPDGIHEISVAFPKVKKGFAFALEDEWCVTDQPTPGEENRCPQKRPPEAIHSITPSGSVQIPGVSPLKTRYRNIVESADQDDSAMQAATGFVFELQRISLSQAKEEQLDAPESTGEFSLMEGVVVAGGMCSSATIVLFRRRKASAY